MLSPKQIEVLRWPYTGKTALICDGAVRSGKTSIMSLSFLLWAMGSFDKSSFALCGKTVGAAERNIIQPLLGVAYLQELDEAGGPTGFTCSAGGMSPPTCSYRASLWRGCCWMKRPSCPGPLWSRP